MENTLKVGDRILWDYGTGDDEGGRGKRNVEVTAIEGDLFSTSETNGSLRWSVTGGYFSIIPQAIHTDPVQTFDTGARRDVPNGKSRPDLIPGGVMLRVGEHFGMGAEKYGERNFEKGIPSSRTLASLCRHVEQFKAGDDSEDHLAAIVANAVFLMFNEGKFVGNDEILDLERYN